MKQILLILLVLSWIFFLFFYSHQSSSVNLGSTNTGSIVTGETLSGITSSVSARVKQILDDTEVRSTLSRIEQDRPKYKQDGAIFMNREKRLPAKSGSYYHEWTVITPGSSDRGARRIIEGSSGELYFTDDHYGHFVRVK